MKIDKQVIFKILECVGILAILAGLLLILNHSVGNAVKTEELLPTVTDEPVYVECEEGKALVTELDMKESFHCTGLQLLLVNFSADSKGTLQIKITDEEQNCLLDEIKPINTIVPGEWFVVPTDCYFEAGKRIEVSFTADGSTPFFMQVDKAEGDQLPFEETVVNANQQVILSMGVNKATPITLTFGDIFYYSVPFSFLLAAVMLVLLFAGKKRCLKIVSVVTKELEKFLQKFGNDIFLALIFLTLTIGIFSEAYIKGVYITSDSADYLREAVNLAAGNGFSYDGLAGYTSWFAKWPLIYPLLIAGMIKLTGLNAYFASKLVTVLMIFLLLLIFRVVFKKDAWFYSLCLTNIGFMNLTYYTWSEIPFMLFQLCFALFLAKIISSEKPATKWYAFLGIAALAGFLTRYFGLYVWFVIAFYLLLLFLQFRKNKAVKGKIIGLTLSAAGSGMLAVLYFLMNKIKNGSPSGISRGTWWDDYQILTQDLIETLLKEITNIFSFQIPKSIDDFPYNIKVLVLVVLLIIIGTFIVKNTKRFTRESVLITMGLIYYLMFIAIRYVSSMDTFYFRFFEPATFLICIGLIGLLLPYLRGKRGFGWFAVIAAAFLIFAVVAVFENGGMNTDETYYASLTGQWEEAYQEIPEKSVVIFSDIDFRSKFYRPDVVEGTMTPQDTYETLKNNYYASDYLCIRADYVITMLESGEYENTIVSKLKEGLTEAEKAKNQYVILNLKN